MFLTLGMSMPRSAEAIRAYIFTLRDRQNISQKDVAKAIGMPLRTYTSWETGETRDIKTPFVARAIPFVRGALDDLQIIANATPEQAQQLAYERLSANERGQVQRMSAKAARIIEIAENDPERLEGVIERLRKDSRTDPDVLESVLAWLDGRRSRNS